jgi:signal peptidase I
MLGSLRRITIGAIELLFRSHFVVRGNSMASALRDGDIVHSIPKKLIGRGIRRGAIVVAEFPGNSDRVVIKRVAGLPGEWVSVNSNGSLSVEQNPQSCVGTAPEEPPASRWVCDCDEYFLVGDNTAESTDSRRYGPVPANAILGRVWLTIPRGILPRHND